MNLYFRLACKALNKEDQPKRLTNGYYRYDYLTILRMRLGG